MIGWKPILLPIVLSFLCSSVCFNFLYLLTKSCVDGRKNFHGRFVQNGGGIKCKECGFISVCNWPSEFIPHFLQLSQAIFSEFISRGEGVLKAVDSEAEVHVQILPLLYNCSEHGQVTNIYVPLICKMKIENSTLIIKIKNCLQSILNNRIKCSLNVSCYYTFLSLACIISKLEASVFRSLLTFIIPLTS